MVRTHRRHSRGRLSSRMGGGDKCLRRLGGRALLAHVIDRLAPQVDGLILNANGDPERFADTACRSRRTAWRDSPARWRACWPGWMRRKTLAPATSSPPPPTRPFSRAIWRARLQAAADAAGEPIALAATPDDSGKFKSGLAPAPHVRLLAGCAGGGFARGFAGRRAQGRSLD